MPKPDCYTHLGKTSKPANILLGTLVVLSLAYPFVVYHFIDKWPTFYFIAGMAGLLLLRSMSIHWKNKKSASSLRGKPLPFAFAVIAALFLLYLWNQQLAPLFYPVIMSLALAATMGLSLIYSPSLIERFARIKEPNLDNNGVRYTRKVTWLWTGFGVFNAAVAYLTILLHDRSWWTLYNGCISYMLIGLLMVGEYVVRRHCKKHPSTCD